MRATVNKDAKEVCLTLSLEEWSTLPGWDDDLTCLSQRGEQTLRAAIQAIDQAIIIAWPPAQENPFFSL